MNGRYNNPMKQCPFCGEAIMANAVKCRFCQEFLDNIDPGVGPCKFCGENVNVNATVCDYCGESLLSSAPRQNREQIPKQYGSSQKKTPSRIMEPDEMQSGFSTYKLPPAGDDFFPYEDQLPSVERCNYCGEQLLSLEDGTCPFCGTDFSDSLSTQSPSYPVKECPFCGESNEISSIKCIACGEVMKISPGRRSSSAVPSASKFNQENRLVEKSVVTGDLKRECLLCGEKNPMNAVKCRVCHEIFSEEVEHPRTVTPVKETPQEASKKRGSLLPPSKILVNVNKESSIPMKKESPYPVNQSRGTREFKSLPAGNTGKGEMQKICPLCGEKNPLSASYCKLCCEELKDREGSPEAMISISPVESVKKSIVTGDLQRECLLCGEKNPVTAVRCRICNEVFEGDNKNEETGQEDMAEEVQEDEYVPGKTELPEISELSEEEEQPRPVRRKSHWETTPQIPVEEIKPSQSQIPQVKQERKSGVKKPPVESPKPFASCPVCKSKLSPSGECPDCQHKQAELEKLVKSTKKKSTLYPIVITGLGVIFILALLSVIGKYAYPIVQGILSHPPKPTEVAVVTPVAEPTAVTPAPVETPVISVLTPEAGLSPTSVPTEVADPTPIQIPKVSFVDIDDNFAKNYIVSLHKLGIFKEINNNKFKPYDKVTRGQYCRWLVNTTNSLFPDRAFNLSSLSKNYYDDVQPAYPDFKYIQLLHDKGYIIGIDGTHFEPDKELTREELMMIRCSLEYDIQYTDIRDLDQAKCISELQNYFRDPNDINKSYLVSFYKDMAQEFSVLNRSFGRVKKVYPGTPVTRSEAAASLGEILGRSSEEAVKKLLSSKSETENEPK